MILYPPSFWPEVRDPWAWQRALQKLERRVLPDPWPCWEQHLRSVLSRRAVPGLYGRKADILLGVGFLEGAAGGWQLTSKAATLANLEREAFEQELARWLVLHSPWLRLALRQLHIQKWSFPNGLDVLGRNRPLQIGRDLITGQIDAEAPEHSLGVPWHLTLTLEHLSALQSPLYLLHAIGWLNVSGQSVLPADLQALLFPATPAAILSRLTTEEADRSGFVPVERTLQRLWMALHDSALPRSLATWSDAVIHQAIGRGSIEVHAWAPGQPRHGRGFGGDRERKLVQWTIHSDFIVEEP